MLAEGRWRREGDSNPTFSEFAAIILLVRVRLGSNFAEVLRPSTGPHARVGLNSVAMLNLFDIDPLVIPVRPDPRKGRRARARSAGRIDGSCGRMSLQKANLKRISAMMIAATARRTAG